MLTAMRSVVILFLLGISMLMAGCSAVDVMAGRPPTVNKTLVIDPVRQTPNLAPYSVSSSAFSGPKSGTVVFTYADVTPPMYVSSMTIPGGRKRADVVYSLGNDVDLVVSKAMAQVFRTDSTASSSVSGQLSFQFSDITPEQRKGHTSSLDIAINMTLDLEVNSGSKGILKRSYGAQKTDVSSGMLITFPSGSFLNALFTQAMGEVLAAVKADKELAAAIGR